MTFVDGGESYLNVEPRHKFEGLVPEMLARSIQERRCVLFAGAGLSAQARTQAGLGLPTWNGLLEEMIDWCINHRVSLRAEPDEIRELLRRGKLLVVAQELQQCLGGRLNTCLSAVLHTGEAKPGEVHRLVSKIGWVATLTSNYDGLIEGAHALYREGVVPPVFVPDGIAQALDCLRNGQFFVFKVHGDVNLPGSVVLSNRDYARVLYLRPAYRSFLEAVFSSYTVLFVGFSGADPDLDGVIDRLSTIYERSIGQHFILVAEDDFSALERRRLLEDKRLDCITYRRDESHSQVVEFFRALSQRIDSDADLRIPFASDTGNPRVFISGSYGQLELSRQIGAVVQEAGCDVWFAETRITPGDGIADVISKAIDAADFCIVVLTDTHAISSWVQFEIGRAFGARKEVLPIRVGGARVPAELMGVRHLEVSSSDLTAEDKERILAGVKRCAEYKRTSWLEREAGNRLRSGKWERALEWRKSRGAESQVDDEE